MSGNVWLLLLLHVVASASECGFLASTYGSFPFHARCCFSRSVWLLKPPYTVALAAANGEALDSAVVCCSDRMGLL